MNYGKTIFSQIMDFIPPYEFRKCVKRYECQYKAKLFQQAKSFSVLNPNHCCIGISQCSQSFCQSNYFTSTIGIFRMEFILTGRKAHRWILLIGAEYSIL